MLPLCFLQFSSSTDGSEKTHQANLLFNEYPRTKLKVRPAEPFLPKTPWQHQFFSSLAPRWNDEVPFFQKIFSHLVFGDDWVEIRLTLVKATACDFHHFKPFIDSLCHRRIKVIWEQICEVKWTKWRPPAWQHKPSDQVFPLICTLEFE